jgi:hypothetical protein
MLYFSCPRCSKSFESKPHLVGRSVKCLECGHDFQIPAASAPPRVQATPAVTPPRADRSLSLFKFCLAVNLFWHVVYALVCLAFVVGSLAHLLRPGPVGEWTAAFLFGWLCLLLVFAGLAFAEGVTLSRFDAWSPEGRHDWVLRLGFFETLAGTVCLPAFVFTAVMVCCAGRLLAAEPDR